MEFRKGAIIAISGAFHHLHFLTKLQHLTKFASNSLCSLNICDESNLVSNTSMDPAEVIWQNCAKFFGPYMSSPSSPGIRGYITIALIKCIGMLPLSVARGLGASIGWLCWVIKEKGSLTTLENLRICFPDMNERERYRLARQSMIETGRLGTEICVIQQRSIEWLNRKIFAVHGEDLIKGEIAKGKGLILLAPHIGNWEVLSLTLPSYGKLTALYQPPKQAYLESLIKNAREKTGATLVPTNRKGVALLLKSLRSGGITAVLPDQNPNKGFGEFSPFYGEQAYTKTTVHGFVQRSECAVILGFVKRVNGGFETYFIQAPEGIYSEDQLESLAALNKGVEKTISYCPEQYQWEYKRFKRRPPGAEKLYKF